MAGFNVSGYAGPLVSLKVETYTDIHDAPAYNLLLEFADSTVHVPGLTGEDVLRLAKACQNALHPPTPEEVRLAALAAFVARARNA